MFAGHGGEEGAAGEEDPGALPQDGLCPVGWFTIIIKSSEISQNHKKERAYRIAIIFLDRIGRLSREPVTI